MTEQPRLSGPSSGPMSYLNWHWLSGAEPAEVMEYPLFTDAQLVGEFVFGPYTIINAIADVDNDADLPSAYLRASLADMRLPDMNSTKDDAHHGGSFENELAALMSLAFGMRVYAGTASRYFQRGGDPKGRPWSVTHGYASRPTLLGAAKRRPVLPHIRGKRTLESIQCLTHFDRLQAEDAIAVMRVARLYQDSVWLAESQPALAWLLMVSAVEAAAQHWARAAAEDLVGRLERWKPELCHAIQESGGRQLLEQAASAIAPVIGSTSKFVKFLIKHAPDPPGGRPPEYAQISWSTTKRSELYSTIYDYRSRALHSGKPFPTPMCDPPRKIADAYGEKPDGSAVGVGFSVWRAKDVPILLSTFELIARQALQNWWQLLLEPVDS